MISCRVSLVSVTLTVSLTISLTSAWAAKSEVATDFSEGFGPWVPLASGTWKIQEDEGNAVAALTEEGVQRPPVRRPTAYLFLADHVWQDTEITLRAKSLEPDSIIKRDVVVIFGYVDDTHYYYTHISALADDGNHNILKKVSGDRRENIHEEILPEARLTEGWHTVRVSHRRTGEIEVFVDDMERPLMTAIDSDYPAGSVAFGSFDDRALFDDVLVRGELFELLPAEVTVE